MSEEIDTGIVREAIEQTSEKIAIELERQIGFFWGAANTKMPIDLIYLTGGGSLIPGLAEELGVKTGVETQYLDNFKNIAGLESFEEAYLKQIGPLLGVSIGLAGRQTGDKVHNIES